MSTTRAEPVHKPWPGLIAAYRDRLPVEDTWTPITLLEGGTPLIHAHASRSDSSPGCRESTSSSTPRGPGRSK